MKNFKLVVGFTVFSLLITSLSFAHDWMAPASANSIQPPVKSNDQTINTGKELYENFCMSCHGEDLQGLSVEQTGLKHNTPNLIARLKTHSPGDFAWKISEGRGEMPSFKEDLDEKEIWSIVYYIQKLSLQQ